MKTQYLIKLKKQFFVFALIILSVFGFSEAMAQYLTGVNPDEGMQGETLQLTISGQNTNFLQATNVSVNLRQGTSTIIYPSGVGVVSNTELYATFGLSFQYNPGMYELHVWDEPDGEMMIEDAFEILENPEQPELTGVEPNQGETGEILNVTISGQHTHFQASSTTVWLKQGTNTIYPGYTVVNSNTEAVAHFFFNQYEIPGVYDVKAYNFIDGELTLFNSFNLLQGYQPAITEIDPISGEVGELLVFDIYGENTHFEDATVIFAYLENPANEIIELDFTIWTNEHLEGAIIIPYSTSPGMYDLHVYNNIDGALSMPEAFNVYPGSDVPEIYSINPDSCYANQQVTVDVHTLNTWYGWSDELFVSLRFDNSVGRIWAENIEIINHEELSVQFDIPEQTPAGFWDLIVEDEICGALVLESGMMIIDTITNVYTPDPATKIKVYPNPTKGQFQISTPEIFGPCRIIVFDACGVKKEFENVPLLPNQTLSFNIDSFADGFYFVQIITSENTIIKKLIKQ
ncbi:MAG: T9SS type A sorting domain-containing protein [Bacteroidales bacterium]|nr:T9SS type A sorting domain-containing protein [Bacteroidales bacterium]